MTLSFSSLSLLAKQLCWISSADCCKVTGKIPSFLEGLDRLPGYRWDNFPKLILLEILLWHYLQRSSSSLERQFCSGKCAKKNLRCAGRRSKEERGKEDTHRFLSIRSFWSKPISLNRVEQFQGVGYEEDDSYILKFYWYIHVYW